MDSISKLVFENVVSASIMNRNERRKHDNQKCACGSGKKFKDCCKAKQRGAVFNRKPREISITFDMGNPVALNGYRMFADENGVVTKMELLQDGEAVKRQTSTWVSSYHRPKGSKVLIDIPIVGDSASINPNVMLAEFTAIFAVDTNTKQIGNKRISIGALVLCEKIETDIQDHTSIDFRIGGIATIQFIDVSDPEKTAWIKAIEWIVKNPSYKQTHKIGLVIDHNYGDVAKYNAGTLPIADNFFLPSNIKLIYASSDTGTNEFLPNRLISMCDKASTQRLNEIEIASTIPE